MPTDVEFCATCGCSEFAHHFVTHECGEGCDDDCTRAADDPVATCDCGVCDDYRWMGEPGALVCRCGCGEDEHWVDEDDPDSVCHECGDCGAFIAWGTELEALRAALATRGTNWPTRPRPGLVSTSMIHLGWIDEPMEVVGALVADSSGQPVRRAGVPRRNDEVFVYFVVTNDGLEIAVTADEIVGTY